jgi:hypothetical protein
VPAPQALYSPEPFLPWLDRVAVAVVWVALLQSR